MMDYGIRYLGVHLATMRCGDLEEMPNDAVKRKTGKRLTLRTWAMALEDIQCAGLPTAKTVTVRAGTFECLEYRWKRKMRGVPMRYRAWFSVKHPGLKVLQEGTAGGVVVRTELVGLRLAGD